MLWPSSTLQFVLRRKTRISLLAPSSALLLFLLLCGCGGSSAPVTTHSVPDLTLTETASDDFNRAEGLLGANWDVSVASSGIDGTTHANSITLMHNAAVANPRQTAYGLSQALAVTLDSDHPKAFWKQSLPADQYVQLTYLGGIAYPEFFAGFDPTGTPQSVGMTGDAYGDFTWENTVTFNSFKAPNATSNAWMTNDFTIHGPNNRGYFGLVLRGNPSQRANFYSLRISPSAPPQFAIYSGTTQLTSGGLASIQAGDVFTFAVVGSTLYSYQNSTLLSRLIDNSLAGGSAGIEINPINVVSYQGQAPVVDNFVVGTAAVK